MKELKIIYFSPTGTTKKVLFSIADGMGYKNFEEINITKETNSSKMTFSQDNIVIIGVPVYAGRIPLVALERLQNIKGENTKAVLVAVYGNRHYDDTLLEMKNLVKERGFIPVAAGAFIGHHSFSSFQYPIATDRPNNKDLKIAKEFGKEIIFKLFIESGDLSLPGNFPYKERSTKLDVKPKTDMLLCNLCGTCANACPVNAITIYKDRIEIDEKLCIYCHACVRVCPQSARIIDDERILASAKRLSKVCAKPRKPELFF